jgi:DNA-binding transcriptional LysR family regulator
MIQTVVANLGVALLPSRLCPNKETNPRLAESIVVRPLVEPEIIHTLYLIWKRGHYLSHAAQLWLDFVRNRTRIINNL